MQHGLYTSKTFTNAYLGCHTYVSVRCVLVDGSAQYGILSTGIPTGGEIALTRGASLCHHHFLPCCRCFGLLSSVTPSVCSLISSSSPLLCCLSFSLLWCSPPVHPSHSYSITTPLHSLSLSYITTAAPSIRFTQTHRHTQKLGESIPAFDLVKLTCTRLNVH